MKCFVCVIQPSQLSSHSNSRETQTLLHCGLNPAETDLSYVTYTVCQIVHVGSTLCLTVVY